LADVTRTTVDLPARPTSDGVFLAVRVSPKAKNDTVGEAVDGPGGRCLVVRVRAAPEDGKANAAVERLVAAWFDVPKSSVSLTSGHRSRYKQLKIIGDAQCLMARAAHLLED